MQNKGRWPQLLDFLALSSAGALGLLREPASRWAAAGSIPRTGPTEADVEDAAGSVADVELVQHAAPTLELGAVLVLLVKGSRVALGREDPAVEMGGEDATMGPGWTMGGDHTTLGGLQPDLLLMTLIGLDSTLRFCPVKGSVEISSTARDGRRQHPEGSSPEGGQEVATVVP